MKATDLRIGNWAWCSEIEDYVRIECIGSDELTDDGPTTQLVSYQDGTHGTAMEWVGHESLFEIPLTPEILEKQDRFIFHMDRTIEWQAYGCYWGLSRMSGNEWGVFMLKDYFFLRTIETVHDLQNYYYFTVGQATGKELSITL